MLPSSPPASEPEPEADAPVLLLERGLRAAAGDGRADVTPVEQGLHSEALYRLALTDHLTGCYNRRFFEDVIARELRLHRRHGTPLSVLFIDIDDLKRVNDERGHLEGDRVLKQVAQFLSQNIRGSDYVFRWGGDEFLVLSGCTREQADQKATQLKAAFLEAAAAQALPPGIGLSIGSAEFGADQGSPDEILRLADRRMYEDKQRAHGGARPQPPPRPGGAQREAYMTAAAEQASFHQRDEADRDSRTRVLEQALAEAAGRCEQLAAEHARERERLEAARSEALIQSRIVAEEQAAERKALEARWAAEAAHYRELLDRAEGERARLVDAVRDAEAKHVAYQAEVREQFEPLAAALKSVEGQIRAVTASLGQSARPEPHE